MLVAHLHCSRLNSDSLIMLPILPSPPPSNDNHPPGQHLFDDVDVEALLIAEYAGDGAKDVEGGLAQRRVLRTGQLEEELENFRPKIVSVLVEQISRQFRQGC